MAADQASEKQPEDLLKLEQALSDRSTCRATGEKIKKGEWRVGIEAWRAGRNSMTWQRAEPFLKNCFVEECTKGNSGTCKLTGHKFAKGESRFVYATGDKKLFLTIPSAAKVIQPVLDVSEEFKAADLKGLDDIPEADRAAFDREFATSPSSRAERIKRRASKSLAEDAKAEQPPKAKKRKSSKAAVKKDEDSEEEEPNEEEDGPEEDGNGADEGDAVKDEQEEAAVQGETNALKDESEEEEEEDRPMSPASPDIPEYEKQRRAIMARNQEKMKELGLQHLAAEIMPKQQPKPRTQAKGLASKKKKVPYEGPRRISLRQKGMHADGRMVDQELRNGHVLVSHNPSPWTVVGEEGPSEPAKPKERHSKVSIAFESDNGEKDLDGQLLDILKRSTTTATKGESGKAQLHKLDLQEKDVAKVTSNGISHIQWHPSSDELILAAADKSGNVGLWHLNQQSKSEGDDDIVLAFTPHHAYVSGMSYDGSLRCLDPSTGSFDLIVSSEEAEFSAMDCSMDGNLAIMGDNDGYLHTFDIRANKGSQRGKEAELHNKRINTLHFAPGDENVFVSSSSDNSLAVWDLRKLGKKMESAASAVHSKTCQSAYFAPDGSKRIVSLSRDDTVQIWQFDGKKTLNPKVSIKHYNNTGRWVLPFRATWSPSADAIVVGNMKRKVDIFSSNGTELGGLKSDYMTAISSRQAIHPNLGYLAASTASGRVHIFR